MPLLITFNGQAVKRRRSVPGGILLTLYAARLHEPGLQILATEEEWQRRGRIQFLPPEEYPDVRSLTQLKVPAVAKEAGFPRV